jgi:hypothetical protein
VPVPAQVLVPPSSNVERQSQSVSGRSAVAGPSNKVERGTYSRGERRLFVSEQVPKVTAQGRSGHGEDVVATDNAVVGEPVDSPDRYLGRQPSDGSGDGRYGHPGQVRADRLPGQDRDWARLFQLSQVDRAHHTRSPKDVCAAKAARSSRSCPLAATIARYGGVALGDLLAPLLVQGGGDDRGPTGGFPVLDLLVDELDEGVREANRGLLAHTNMVLRWDWRPRSGTRS